MRRKNLIMAVVGVFILFGVGGYGVHAQEETPSGVNGKYGTIVIGATDIFWIDFTFTPPDDFKVGKWNGRGSYFGDIVFGATFTAIDASIGGITENVTLIIAGITQDESTSILGVGYLVEEFPPSSPLVFIGFK